VFVYQADMRVDGFDSKIVNLREFGDQEASAAEAGDERAPIRYQRLLLAQPGGREPPGAEVACLA
jgi:hypothetical protein